VLLTATLSAEKVAARPERLAVPTAAVLAAAAAMSVWNGPAAEPRAPMSGAGRPLDLHRPADPPGRSDADGQRSSSTLRSMSRTTGSTTLRALNSCSIVVCARRALSRLRVSRAASV
jgi:hypothetical protein